MYKDYVISLRDDNIKAQQKMIDDMNIQIQELLNNSRNSQERLTVVEEDLSETKEELASVEEELDVTNTTLEKTITDLSVVQTKLGISVEDRAVKPRKASKVNQIGILRSNLDNSILYLTCGQKSSVDRAIRLKSKSHMLVDTIDKVPNSIYLFDHIRKEFGSEVNIMSRIIKLVSVDESNFLRRLRLLFDERRNIDFTKKPE
jgi:chromosome segregation ATPase